MTDLHALTLATVRVLDERREQRRLERMSAIRAAARAHAKRARAITIGVGLLWVAAMLAIALAIA